MMLETNWSGQQREAIERVQVWLERGGEEVFRYALTVHKAQGSQWERVCLVDESWCFREQRSRWLYTGITRAADLLTVVR